MDSGKKTKILIILGIFGAAVIFFVALTIHDYYHFSKGESVQGTVVKVEDHYFRRGRKYYATISVTMGEKTVDDFFRVSSSKLTVGGLKISGTEIKEGDQIEMLAVPDGDSYDIAIADEIRRSWISLLFEFFALVLVGLVSYRIVKNK